MQSNAVMSGALAIYPSPPQEMVRLVESEMGEPQSNPVILLLESRALPRECFANSFRAEKLGMDIVAFASIEEWKTSGQSTPRLSAVLLGLGSSRITDQATIDELDRIAREFKDVPIIVLADSEDVTQILKALELKVRGYIPSSVGMHVCVEAIDLALAGGFFVPANSLLAMRKSIDNETETAPPMGGMFTLRQSEVVDALRRGKANKIIAYELKLRESTVKVHIRNIMKKLKATNRTEVACKINDLFPKERHSASPRFHG